MRIIQIADKLNNGAGVPSFVFDLCAALKKSGHDVTLIGILKNNREKPRQIDDLLSLGVEVIELNAPNKKTAIAKYIPVLRRTIKKISTNEPTICNLHLKLSVLMGAVASVGLKNIKCVETYHNTYHHYHLEHYMLMPIIKKYITVSETAQQEMYQRFHTPKEKVIAAPNGVDVYEIRRIAEKADINKKDGVIDIVTVARLSYEKNVGKAVEAFSSVCNEKVEYTVVGGGPQLNEIKEIASSNPFINFAGAVSRENALSWVKKADIVVMPSLWEGRSILMMEAMALGKPLMLSDVPGLREPFGEKELESNELYRRCKFGYLVKTMDKNSYREAMLDFIDNNYLAREMEEYVAQKGFECDIKKMIDTYLQVYKSIFEFV